MYIDSANTNLLKKKKKISFGSTSYPQGPWLTQVSRDISGFPSPRVPQFSKLQEKATSPLTPAYTQQFPLLCLPSLSEIPLLLRQTVHYHLGLNLILTITCCYPLYLQVRAPRLGKITCRVEGRLLPSGHSHAASHSTPWLHSSLGSQPANCTMLFCRFWPHHLLEGGLDQIT